MLRKKDQEEQATTSFNHKLLEVYFSAVHLLCSEDCAFFFQTATSSSSSILLLDILSLTKQNAQNVNARLKRAAWLGVC